ncbi:MAG: DNA polymerase III subunit alpha, partial [Candidatus Latescibacteria bacterium]|nr:DNA polymerase III subunit alpha [Candidatus Latescibacterota bacterium]
MTDFCHLHAHSSFSLLDGLSRPEQMAKRAKELGQPSIAITDHGTMYGAIQFYKACKAAGVKPLIGCEVYVSTRGHTDREHGVDNKSYHLVLLARNKVGYGNLIQLTSKAHLDGFYYKPRVDHALLKEYGGGLVGLSACIGGEVPQAVLNRGMDRARELVTIYQNCFDHFFLEVQHHPEIPEQETANEGILALGKEMGVPVVATNDSHYPCKDDAEAQDALLAIQTQTTLNDTKRMSMLDGDYSLTSTEEMEAHFGQGSELLTNTMAVADLCDLEIELGQGRLPPFETPDDLSSAAYLRQLCEEGLTKRYPIHRSPDSSWAVNEGVSEDEMSATIPEILDRMDFELKIIERMGYEVYFLIVWDFVRFAKENDIVVGPGRGSAAGALVTYALNVTDIDPLKYNLVFERFLNPDRISMPDIDIDFDDENRDRVIEYVRDKYGRDCVASIIVFGTMAAKAAVKDVARVMSLSYDEGDKLAKMIPARPGVSLTEALDESSDFREAFDKDPTSRRVIDLALRLEGVNRHASVHACAIVISEKPLTDYTPLQCAPRGDEVTITQYGAYELEELGLLKMDFLGLRNHTVIKHTVEMVHRQLGVEVDVYNLPEDDGKTYRLFSRGDTTAIFQFESSGMKRYLRELRPTTFEDIMAMVALYRPGPMAFISEFIARKHGRKEIKYDHPLVVPALSNTYGVTVCQEQVMQISREMAGFTRGEADTLRKAMGKKDKDLMLEMEEKFISGAEKNSVPKATAEKIWVDWEEFARYAFNWA